MYMYTKHTMWKWVLALVNRLSTMSVERMCSETECTCFCDPFCSMVALWYNFHTQPSNISDEYTPSHLGFTSLWALHRLTQAQLAANSNKFQKPTSNIDIFKAISWTRTSKWPHDLPRAPSEPLANMHTRTTHYTRPSAIIWKPGTA